MKTLRKVKLASWQISKSAVSSVSICSFAHLPIFIDRFVRNSFTCINQMNNNYIIY